METTYEEYKNKVIAFVPTFAKQSEEYSGFTRFSLTPNADALIRKYYEEGVRGVFAVGMLVGVFKEMFNEEFKNKQKEDKVGKIKAREKRTGFWATGTYTVPDTGNGLF